MSLYLPLLLLYAGNLCAAIGLGLSLNEPHHDWVNSGVTAVGVIGTSLLLIDELRVLRRTQLLLINKYMDMSEKLRERELELCELHETQNLNNHRTPSD